MSTKVTAPHIRSLKGTKKIVCLTAYDAFQAQIADESGVDVILVGDSVGNVVLGYETTLPVSLNDIAHHLRAARKGVRNALLIADMPFGSYGSSVQQAVDSAVLLMKNGAEAVKLEGTYCEEIAAIVKCGIPVMGHVGFTPQSVFAFGGHKVQGRDGAAEEVVSHALKIDSAGAFSIVLELVPVNVAETITKKISCPSIGIGAGISCDGQIQVFHDILGLTKLRLRHAKRYLDGYTLFGEAIAQYVAEVRNSEFPTPEQSF